VRASAAIATLLNIASVMLVATEVGVTLFRPAICATALLCQIIYGCLPKTMPKGVPTYPNGFGPVAVVCQAMTLMLYLYDYYKTNKWNSFEVDEPILDAENGSQRSRGSNSSRRSSTDRPPRRSSSQKNESKSWSSRLSKKSRGSKS